MNKVRLEKGITLVALVITIIVLLILAVVAIGAVRDSGIVGHAQNSADIYNTEKAKEQSMLGEYEDEISEYEKGGNIKENIPVTNPEKNPDAWDIAYSYNGSTWTKLTGGGKVEGKIVAKFYKKDVRVQPGDMWLGISYKITPPSKDYSYKLVVEGKGDMPELGDLDTTTSVAWQEGMFEVMTTQKVGNYIMPYITEITVCEGITSIGAWAFTGVRSIEKVTLPRTLKKIDTYAFANTSLKDITIPNEVTEIGIRTFQFSDEIKEIRLPAKVTRMVTGIFEYCYSLNKIYIETEASNFTLEQFVFSGIGTDAIIYVRNEDIANKIKDQIGNNVKISTDYNWK